MKTLKCFICVFALLMGISFFTACGDGNSGVDSDDQEEQSDSIGGTQDGKKGCPDTKHPHAIDLGLPSGTKWCCCNVGATAPQEYGGIYAWGETSEKNAYTLNNYVHYDSISGGCLSLGTDIAGTAYDVARVVMGDKWQMPTHEQMEELIKNCTYYFVWKKDSYCLRVKGPNDNYIFLPAAGAWWDAALSNKNSTGNYWSSTYGPKSGTGAYGMYFGAGYWDSKDCTNRYGGLSVRAVKK